MNLGNTTGKLLTLPFVLLFQYFLNKQLSFGDINILNRFFVKNWKYLAAYGALYPLFMVQSTYFSFSDEYDNILGGWLMSNHHQIIYRDFFSHHMPLPYFVSAIITYFTQNNLNMFRFVFISLCFVWLLFIARNLRQLIGDKLTVFFILLLGLAQYLTWAHMILAETFIAYAVLHIMTLILLQLRDPRVFTRKNMLLVSILCAIPVLAALSYSFLTAVLYAGFGFIYLRNNLQFGKKINVLRIAQDALILGIPYISLGLWLVVTHSVHPFITEAYNFNKNYYSQFTNDVAPTLTQTLINNTTDLVNNIAAIFGVNNRAAQLIAVLSFTVLLAYIAMQLLYRRWYLSIFTTAVFFTMALRDDVILRVFADGNNRMSGVYAVFVLLLSILTIHRAINVRVKELGLASITQLSAGFIAITLVSMVFVKSAAVVLHVEEVQHKGVETGLELNKEGGHIPRVINFVANGPNDYYWVGPFDFHSQLYINAHRSSQYTFFLPWQSICDKCEHDITSDFKTQQPKVIYWQHDMSVFRDDIRLDDYNKQILSLLDTDYYNYGDDKYLKNFYFLKSDREAIDKKLVANKLIYGSRN